MAAALEQITGTLKKTAENARRASELAIGSRSVAEKGGKVVAAAVQAMDEINAASKKIVDIIGTIDAIAFQTHLLALNPAVEGADPWQLRHRLAVVAGEGTGLAQRTPTSSKE